MTADHPPEPRPATTALPALAAGAAVAMAATGAGLLVPGADLGDSARWGVRAAGAVCAVVALVALTTRWGRAARVPASQLVPVLAIAAATLAGVAGLTFGFSPVELTSSRGDDQAGPTTTWRTTTTQRVTTTSTSSTTSTTFVPSPPERRSTGWDPSVLLAPFGFAVVGALVLFAFAHLVGPRSRSRWTSTSPLPPATAPETVDRNAAKAGLEASLAAVGSDSAPRDAISDAYARLLAALAEAGAGRRPQEAPHEHLHRVLTPLGVRSEPLHRLAELFVLARFSQHPVTAAHRADATASLGDALDDLRATRAEVAP